jgi:phosphopantetheinyl transferase
VCRFHRPQKNGEQLVGRHNPDAKSACVGRLLIRKLIHEQLNIPYKDIELKRTKENKPYLVSAFFYGIILTR